MQGRAGSEDRQVQIPDAEWQKILRLRNFAFTRNTGLRSWYFVDRASHYNLFFLFTSWYTVLPSTYNICYPLSSTCFRPHRPIIRRSKLYKQPMVFSPSADVFVVRPLRKKFFPNGRTTKTSTEVENTIGCMYNLDLLMMGLWGLKHVQERR